MIQKERDELQLHKQHLQAYRMAILTQTLVFQRMIELDFRDALALMNTHIRANLDEFRSDKLESPNKMFYDCVRVLGLMIATEINITLIQLSQRIDTDPSDDLKRKLYELLVNICNNSMLLKTTDQQHLMANFHHLEYSKAKFADVIQKACLHQEVEMALSYIQHCSSNQSVDFSVAPLLDGGELAVSPQMAQRLHEENVKLRTMEAWRPTDLDLPFQFERGLRDFKAFKNGIYLEWHYKIIESDGRKMLWNESFES